MADGDKSDSSLGLWHALARGTAGFTVVSVAGFAVWAFGGKWFYSHAGEAGLYAVSALVFLGLSGLLLHPLVMGERRLCRFYKIFVPAFLAYAIAWCACWFLLHFGLGEWLGSFLGCAAFALVLAKSFGNYRMLLPVVVVMFLTHSAGYFTGGIAMQLFQGNSASLTGISRQSIGVIAKLLWGVCFGAGFGLGLGYGFFAMQQKRKAAV